MRKELFRLLVLTAGAGFWAAGCAGTPRGWVREPATPACPTGEVVVTEALPPPRQEIEIAGTQPEEAHLWVAGYWMFSDQKWVWITGHWEPSPHPVAGGVPGH
jgi:hypothetical protein